MAKTTKKKKKKTTTQLVKTLAKKVLPKKKPRKPTNPTMKFKRSFPEFILYEYLNDVFGRVETSYKLDPARLGRLELDLYLPKQSIGIEYDGSMYHEKKSDMKKVDIVHSMGIRLIRIREEGLPILPTKKCIQIPCQPDRSYYYLFDVMLALEKQLIPLTGIRPTMNKKKFEQYLHQAYLARIPFYTKKDFPNKLTPRYRKLQREWDTKANYPLPFESMLKSNYRRVHWVCSKGHRWEQSFVHRLEGKDCPTCAKQK